MLADLCVASDEKRILISHGTDTILTTAEHLATRLKATTESKVIVLTGSFLPESFKDSDADFNLGMGFAALQLIQPERAGVYVAVDGIIAPWDRISRDLSSGKFKVAAQ